MGEFLKTTNLLSLLFNNKVSKKNKEISKNNALFSKIYTIFLDFFMENNNLVRKCWVCAHIVV